MSQNNGLRGEGLEAAHAAYAKTTGGLLDGHPMANAITAYLAASPIQADGLEVVAEAHFDDECEICINPLADAIERLDPTPGENWSLVTLSQAQSALAAMKGERDEAEEAENEAKDCFWAIYPRYLELGGEPVSTEAARTLLADRIEALKEALMPFANVYRFGPVEDDEVWSMQVGTLTIQHFIAARTALSESNKP